MSGVKSLSETQLSYCGYKVINGELVKSKYDPDPYALRSSQIKSPAVSLDDGMLYDDIDIGTDLCK